MTRFAAPAQGGLRACCHLHGLWPSRGVIPPSAGTTRCLVSIEGAITGTYRALRKKHMVRHLAEFERRFNHRFDLP
jgi:hypothetical protein